MTTVISLIPNDDHQSDGHLTTAVAELRALGLSDEQISVLRTPGEVWRHLDGPLRLRRVLKVAAIGMLLGLGVGLLYAVPAGVLNCLLGDCPVTTSLLSGVLITLFWIAGGGLLGAIVGLAQMELNFYSYVEGVRRGEPLLVVAAPAAQVPAVTEILTREAGSLVYQLQPA